MKHLNNIQDLINQKSIESGTAPDIFQIIKTPVGKKTKRVNLINTQENIVDSIQSTTNPQTPKFEQDIVIPKTIGEISEQKFIESVQQNTLVNNTKEISERRSKIKNKQVTQEENQQVKTDLELIKNEVLPEDINYPQLEEEVDTALTDIPDGKNFDIIDVEIIKLEKKDKSGYFKTKVNIKKSNIPDLINKIASYIKKQTNGLISPRVCDLRVIGNTNKTQLRGSSLKLSAATIVFKPDHLKLKVNKGTRFMISIPENHESTGNILVYMQESRAKKILEISGRDFASEQAFIEFIGDRVAEYYFSGYEVTLKKLELRNTDNPLMSLITKIVGTHEYKAKPYVDDNSHIYAVDFFTKGLKNQWLVVQIIESDIKGTYQIIARNTADNSWEYMISKKDVTLNQLLKNLYDVLGTCYDKDWDISESDKIYYLFDKLTHNRLKKALIFLNEFSENNAEIGLIVKEALSKAEIAKAINPGYDAEAIIGKTNFIDYYILTFLAHQIVGGDKRSGKDYITTDEYYQKYNVNNRADYSERKKTVLAKQGIERNYNSRIYMFQLEYSVNGKQHVYRNTNWDELLVDTGLLTNSPKFTKSKY